jgi:hypothetical protein
VNSLIAKQMVKKRQMRWTPRCAHLVLQVRTRTLDGQLDTAVILWQAANKEHTEQVPAAA